MTKRHFIALADIMRKTRAPKRVREALADYCAQENPRFDRARWMDYIAGRCGPSGGARPIAADGNGGRTIRRMVRERSAAVSDPELGGTDPRGPMPLDFPVPTIHVPPEAFAPSEST